MTPVQVGGCFILYDDVDSLRSVFYQKMSTISIAQNSHWTFYDTIGLIKFKSTRSKLITSQNIRAYWKQKFSRLEKKLSTSMIANFNTYDFIRENFSDGLFKTMLSMLNEF